MKKRLQRILSLLCAVALVLGCFTAFAEEANVQKEARIISVEWKDGNDQDGIRPASLAASLAGQSVTLSAENGWAGEVSVPVDTENAWSFATPEGYTAEVMAGVITIVVFHHAVSSPDEGPTTSVTASVFWDDADNAAGLRPTSVQLVLLADGAAYGELKSAAAPGWTATWSNLPEGRAYSVQQLSAPEGYAVTESGLQVTNTLQKGNLYLVATVSGAPEGTDLSGLRLTVTGPDPSMPKTLNYSQLIGGTYDFGEVVPGAYLVRGTNADGLVEGYVMDAANSRISDAVQLKAGESATLTFQYTWKEPDGEAPEEDYDPMANIGNLTIEILGPDPRMPMTIYYSQFTNGRFELDNLVPGVYTVIERNAETLIKYYTLTTESITGMTLTVTAGGTAIATLFNQYAPMPTPEPEDELIDFPVNKIWNDSNDADGNRPESITVRLYADGAEVASHVLTAAEGWSYVFEGLPRYQEDGVTEIVYTITEDAVPMYNTTIAGNTIVNDYVPEVTSVAVNKIWNDDNNAQGIRPASIAMMLSNGTETVTVVLLSEENGWTATVNDLPTIVNGQHVHYAWTEQDVLGYTLESVTQNGNSMTFTNAVWQRPENPTQGRPPKTPGNTYYVFEDYETPLGVEIVINHVGDCFD